MPKKLFVFLVNRQYEGHETFYIIINFGTEQEEITLKDNFKDVPLNMTVRVSSINLIHEVK